MKLRLVFFLLVIRTISSAQIGTVDISAAVFSVTSTSTYNGVQEHGIVVSYNNNSKLNYYIENGLSVDFLFEQNGIVKKTTDFPRVWDNDEGMESIAGPFFFTMALGFNQYFNKPRNMYDYGNSFLQKMNPSKEGIKGINLGIVYLESQRQYTFYFDLTNYKIKGKYNVALLYSFDQAKITEIMLPDSIGDFKRFRGTIRSEPIEIEFK